MINKLTIREGASNLVVTVLIWSVVGVLVTRLFLIVTGNPMIGKGQWHVSHMLFGGILMMFGMMASLIFKGDKLEKTVAIIFGLGWGLFIDEVGKFLTRDYNYWFRPAVMIIYISFVILFLIQKYIGMRTIRVKRNIKVAKNKLSLTVNKIISRKALVYGLWAYSVYYSIDKILDILRISTSPQKMMMIEKFYQDYDFFGKSDIYLMVFKLIFDAVTSVLFLLGARYFWSKKRLLGVRLFRFGLYVNILLSAPLSFYFEQLKAVNEVLLAILLLEILARYRVEIRGK